MVKNRNKTEFSLFKNVIKMNLKKCDKMISYLLSFDYSFQIPIPLDLQMNDLMLLLGMFAGVQQTLVKVQEFEVRRLKQF